ncbi:MAG: hypothetical protein ACE5GB_10475 [Acidimicrobiales bacterium]
MTGEIDWEPLQATLANDGPDSARRIGDAARSRTATAWVREGLDAATTAIEDGIA